MEVSTGAGAGTGVEAAGDGAELAGAGAAACVDGAIRIRRVVTTRRTTTRRSAAAPEAGRLAGPSAGSRPCAIASPSQPAAIANAAAAEA